MTAEAPGKVIIAGEHFVVHGAMALVAAVGRGTRAEASRGDRLVVHTSLQRSQGAAPHPLPVEKVVREMYRERSLEPAVRLKISSDLPTGAGLGSSASTMVAAVAAVSKLEGWDLDANSIVEAAMLGEKMVHGKPSGVDVASSVFGGVLEFQIGAKPRQVPMEKHAKLVVVYSGKHRNSGRLISKVSSMKTRYPSMFSKLCEAETIITRLATEHLLDGRMEELGRLMTYNHAVLGMMGASNEQLDRIVDLCIESGCLGAKLTGAGGGGSVIAVAPRGMEDAIAETLTKNGFSTFITEIPNGGLKVRTSEQ